MDDSMPLVSVIMPAHNTERFILDAVESVLHQTMRDLELIIVDDCSTDRTRDILIRIAQNDPRITVLTNKENLGAAQSRNLAFQFARGKYVALLDSDDLWKPDKLSKQIAAAQETGADIVYCSYEMIDENGENHWKDFIVPEQTDWQKMLSSSVISCSTALLSEEICKRFRFPLHTYHEDYAYWLSLLRRGFKAIGLREVLASYRVRSDSRSFNKLRSARERWHVYRDFLGLSVGKSLLAILGYAFAGVKKYWKYK